MFISIRVEILNERQQIPLHEKYDDNMYTYRLSKYINAQLSWKWLFGLFAEDTNLLFRNCILNCVVES